MSISPYGPSHRTYKISEWTIETLENLVHYFYNLYDIKMQMVVEEKKLYRRKIKQSLLEYQQQKNLCIQEEEACKILVSSQFYQDASTILAYAASPQEFSLDCFIQQALIQGKKLFLPKSYPHNYSMEFFQLNTLPLQQQVICGPYGIREPQPHLPLLVLDTLPAKTLILVPGLAFSQDGRRLGKGKGYYDRFLSHILSHIPIQNKPVLMGVCYSFQLLDYLPTEKNDVTMDYILTPSKIITC